MQAEGRTYGYTGRAHFAPCVALQYYGSVATIVCINNIHSAASGGNDRTVAGRPSDRSGYASFALPAQLDITHYIVE
jgi:hypothetical protein